eukprot:scaffold50_cov420-Prasinococcus_capsulatus_cf.AAC.10
MGWRRTLGNASRTWTRLFPPFRAPWVNNEAVPLRPTRNVPNPRELCSAGSPTSAAFRTRVARSRGWAAPLANPCCVPRSQTYYLYYVACGSARLPGQFEEHISGDTRVPKMDTEGLASFLQELNSKYGIYGEPPETPEKATPIKMIPVPRGAAQEGVGRSPDALCLEGTPPEESSVGVTAAVATAPPTMPSLEASVETGKQAAPALGPASGTHHGIAAIPRSMESPQASGDNDDNRDARVNWESMFLRLREAGALLLPATTEPNTGRPFRAFVWTPNARTSTSLALRPARAVQPPARGNS